ncbi:hypothetical protein BC332_22700 [Capsicum chinense]|nr:hypothetical protein BC332_22700 [Capsicum chinense]
MGRDEEDGFSESNIEHLRTQSLALSACTTLVFVEPKLTAETRNLVMKGSILGVEVELLSKSYSTKLVTEENEKEPKTIAKIEDGLFLKPHIFTLTIPEELDNEDEDGKSGLFYDANVFN